MGGCLPFILGNVNGIWYIPSTLFLMKTRVITAEKSITSGCNFHSRAAQKEGCIWVEL
jgi:hypothetical protein